MMEYAKAKTLLKEIAIRHKQAFDASDWSGMGRAEEEALIVCDAYDYPVHSPNLLLASHWPDAPK